VKFGDGSDVAIVSLESEREMREDGEDVRDGVRVVDELKVWLRIWVVGAASLRREIREPVQFLKPSIFSKIKKIQQ